MTVSRMHQTDSGEPSSYQHMEKALSRAAAVAAAAAEAGEASQESKYTRDPNATRQSNLGLVRGAAHGNLPASPQLPQPLSTNAVAISAGYLGEITSDKRRDAEILLSAVAQNNLEAPRGSLKREKRPSRGSGSDHTLSPIQQPSILLPVTSCEELVNHTKAQAANSDSPIIRSTESTSTASRGPMKKNERRSSGSQKGSNKIDDSGPATPIGLNVHVPSSPTPSTSSKTKTTGAALRRGKWTVEEEAYVARVIQEFNSGFLNARAGSTLRSYLSEKLQCDPMRITKKFTGDSCIGKRVFHPAVRSASNAAAIDKAQAELDALERRWRRRLEMQQRDSAKKAAASAAAATSSAGGRISGSIGHGSSGSLLQSAGNQGSNNINSKKSGVARTATWLDRANAILKGKQRDDNEKAATNEHDHEGNDSTSLLSSAPRSQALSGNIDDMPKAEIENQMKEVQRLIYEGPIIKSATADLSQSLESGVQTPPLSGSQGLGEISTNSPESPDIEPADKRLRTGHLSGAEDAEALVGFLRSVRASAASGEFSN